VPQLRTMLAEVGARQFGPISLRTQKAQCGDVGHTGAPVCGVSVAS
jgi:hypothetical protein